MSRTQSTNFVVLTGHLNDYPLSDLIGILRHQRKTGRLLIEYPVGPCSFYFVEGDLVDAQLNTLGSLQAVIVALSQPDAAFNFNPLIQAPRRSITESSQKVILELLGCWEEKTIETGSAAAATGEKTFPALSPPATLEVIDAGEEGLLPRAKEMLALPPAPSAQPGALRSRQVLIMSAIVSLVVSILTVTALTSWLIGRNGSRSETARNAEALRNQTATTEANTRTVRVIVQVKDGRVSRAFVAEHRAGLEAYEALALKVARGRRYPAQASGQETVLVSIKSPR